MDKKSTTAGGKAMNHGKEEKQAVESNFSPSSWRGPQAAPPAPARRAGSFLPKHRIYAVCR